MCLLQVISYAERDRRRNVGILVAVCLLNSLHLCQPAAPLLLTPQLAQVLTAAAATFLAAQGAPWTSRLWLYPGDLMSACSLSAGGEPVMTKLGVCRHCLWRGFHRQCSPGAVHRVHGAQHLEAAASAATAVAEPVLLRLGPGTWTTLAWSSCQHWTWRARSSRCGADLASVSPTFFVFPTAVCGGAEGHRDVLQGRSHCCGPACHLLQALSGCVCSLHLLEISWHPVPNRADCIV